MPVEFEFRRPPNAPQDALPVRRPAATDTRLFASRLTSVPLVSVDPDVRAVAAAGFTPATTEREYRCEVGRRLRLARIGAALSQDEVARSAGVTRNFISAIERGTRGLDASRLGRVADGLGVTLSWLLGRAGQ